MLRRGSTEFQAVECEEPGSTSEEIHSLLLDQAEASVQKQDSGMAEKQIFESVYDNSMKSSGVETTLLSQLDYTACLPHLCQEHNPGANAFGLRDLHHAPPPPPGFTNSIVAESNNTDRKFLNVQPSSGVTPFPQDLHCYSSPFQQDTPLPLHHAYYATTTTAQYSDTFYTDWNQNTLFPLSSVDHNFDQSSSTTIPAVPQNKLQAVVQSGVSTKPYEHFASQETIDCMKEKPSTVTYVTDSTKPETGHQLFSNDASPSSLASEYDKDIPDNRSYVSSAGTIGETKPIGCVPAIKGTKLRSEVEAATEADNIGQLGQDIDARLTTTARVQPSSKLPSQQQAAGNSIKAEVTETTESEVHSAQTGAECQSTKDIVRPAMMPVYPGPVPWPMPPYPGTPFPYPYYPPWGYCPPVPMMPMMPHPMMQMVPVPCWMPPMHPAMRMRLQMMPTVAAEATEKPEVESETKP